MERPVSVALIQCGSATESKEENLKSNLRLLDKAAQKNPDFICFSELSTTPYFPMSEYDNEYFEWAEPIPGPTTSVLAEKARQHQCYIIAPFFEKTELEYYNSAVVLGPDGDIVQGKLPGGRVVGCYRKNHIPSLPGLHKGRGNEKWYFGFSADFDSF